jgi:hypothetical protein
LRREIRKDIPSSQRDSLSKLDNRLRNVFLLETIWYDVKRPKKKMSKEKGQKINIERMHINILDEQGKNVILSRKRKY